MITDLLRYFLLEKSSGARGYPIFSKNKVGEIQCVVHALLYIVNRKCSKCSISLSAMCRMLGRLLSTFVFFRIVTMHL